MRYTLITSDGYVNTFFLLSCAQVYQRAYGGTIIDEAILGTVGLDMDSVMV